MCETRKQKSRWKTGAAILFATSIMASAAFAQDVRLIANDGSAEITGRLVSFIDGNYLVRTDVGTLALSSNDVRCEGAACPSGAASVQQAAAVTVQPSAPIQLGRPDVSYAGSDTVGLGVMPFLMEGYAGYLNAQMVVQEINGETEQMISFMRGDTPLARHLLVSTGSGDAFDALADKTAHFGMASRPARPGEIEVLRRAGVGDITDPRNETVIAVDSLAVIVNERNPVTSLSLSQLERIYTGSITNWRQVGGPDAPITVLSREDGSSTRGVYENVIFSGRERPLGPDTVYPGGDNPEMAAAVRADAFAIGYVGFAYSQGTRVLDLAGECGLVGRAEPFSVKTEEYPLGRRLYLYNRPDNMPPEARQFMEYALSTEADAPIEASGFVSLGVARQSRSFSFSDANRLVASVRGDFPRRLASQLGEEIVNWDRLSTTIRFPPGSSALGQKERNDIARLIGYLETLPSGSEVAIVGFTDSDGAFSYNLTLADQRARSVARSIARAAGQRLPNVRFQTKSYSELMPSACNTDVNGKAINRRVEVWVRS